MRGVRRVGEILLRFHSEATTLVAMEPHSDHLLQLMQTEMPFGKYKGRLLIDLPEPYVVWLYHNALPKGQIGRFIAEIYEIKLNGLEELLRPLR